MLCHVDVALRCATRPRCSDSTTMDLDGKRPPRAASGGATLDPPHTRRTKPRPCRVFPTHDDGHITVFPWILKSQSHHAAITMARQLPTRTPGGLPNSTGTIQRAAGRPSLRRVIEGLPSRTISSGPGRRRQPIQIQLRQRPPALHVVADDVDDITHAKFMAVHDRLLASHPTPPTKRRRRLSEGSPKRSRCTSVCRVGEWVSALSPRIVYSTSFRGSSAPKIGWLKSGLDNLTDHWQIPR
jgi:hypothetical protein